MNPASANLADDATSETSKSPRSGRVAFIATAIAALVLIVTGAMYITSRGGTSGENAPPLIADVGEAPSGKSTGYAEIDGDAMPANSGRFENTARDGGPIFRDSGVIFLGTAPGRSEQEGETPDDGLVIPWGYPIADPAGVVNGLGPCSRNRVVVVLDTAKLPEKFSGETAYINAFFDWNRDGRWQGTDGCADEWGVRNQPVSLADSGRRSSIAVPTTFDAGRQTLDFWFRLTVSIDERLDGPAPGSALSYGEAEDGHFADGALRRIASGSVGDTDDSCASDPPTVLAAKTRSLMRLAGGGSGSRPGVEFPAASPMGPEGSAARAGEVRTTLGAAPARSSAWVELNLPNQSGARKAKLTFEIGGQRKTCVLWQLGADALSDGQLGTISEARTPATSQSQTPEGLTTADPLGGILCPYRELNGGETTSVGLQDFGPSRVSYSPSVATQPTDSTATIAGARVHIVGALPPKSATSSLSLDLAGVSGNRQVGCAITVNGKLPPRAQSSGDDPANPSSPGPSGSASPSITFGSYKIRFSKKSDSCGKFAFREDDTIQVRPAPKGQIEISRPATGNRSLGTLSGNDNSFLATGSGARKDGVAYVEQYQGRFNGPNVSGNYELQQGECRATFSFDGAKS